MTPTAEDVECGRTVVRPDVAVPARGRAVGILEAIEDAFVIVVLVIVLVVVEVVGTTAMLASCCCCFSPRILFSLPGTTGPRMRLLAWLTSLRAPRGRAVVVEPDTLVLLPTKVGSTSTVLRRDAALEAAETAVVGWSSTRTFMRGNPARGLDAVCMKTKCPTRE